MLTALSAGRDTLVGDPAVLVVDEGAAQEAPALRAGVDEVARRHVGAVLTVTPVRAAAGPAEPGQPVRTSPL